MLCVPVRGLQLGFVGVDARVTDGGSMDTYSEVLPSRVLLASIFQDIKRPLFIKRLPPGRIRS